MGYSLFKKTSPKSYFTFLNREDIALVIVEYSYIHSVSREKSVLCLNKVIKNYTEDPNVLLKLDDFSFNISSLGAIEEDSPYTCPNCGSKRVFTTQEQIRSGDEGATTFYNCRLCSYYWNF